MGKMETADCELKLIGSCFGVGIFACCTISKQYIPSIRQVYFQQLAVRRGTVHRYMHVDHVTLLTNL